MLDNSRLLGTPPAFLFCPADDAHKLSRLPQRGVTAVVLDLEDAVLPEQRSGARELLRQLTVDIADTVRTYVRVNVWGSADHELDMDLVRALPIAGVLVPKVESREPVREVAAMLLRDGNGPKVLPMIETGRGLTNVVDIAESAPGRVETLILGTADLATDLGLSVSIGEPELSPYRATVVAAARAAGLSGPIDGPELDLRSDGFIESCERSRRAGFSGRVCLTPHQAHTAATAYTRLTSEELARLRSVIEGFEAAQREGRAAIQIAGAFVDPPVYRQALSAVQRHTTFTTVLADAKGVRR